MDYIVSRVAVLIPVYNAPQGLARTLESIDAQPGSFDVFVVDDGSDPNLVPIKTDYRHAVHWLTLSANRGCAVARNEGLRVILDRGYDYVASQDAGDVDVDGRIQAQTLFLDANPSVALVGGWAQYVDTSGAPLYVDKLPASTEQIRRHMHYISAFCHPACMFRIEALRTLRLYDPSFGLAEDHELFFRMSRAFPVANLQKILVVKEENPGSLSLARRRTAVYYRMKVQIEYFDFTCRHSYLGLLYSLALLVIPYPLLLKLKKQLKYQSAGAPQ